MGFNKRYIKKDIIINNVDNVNYISNLVNADALIVDSWSDKFFKNFNFKWKTYNEIRKEIIDDTKLDSHHNGIINHQKYKDLFSLSNTFLNLKTNPHWIDIHLSHDILTSFRYTPFIEDEISGKLDLLANYYIKLIDEFYQNNN